MTADPELNGVNPCTFIVENIRYYPFHLEKDLRICFVLRGEIELRGLSGANRLSLFDAEFINCDEPVEIHARQDDNRVLVMRLRYDYLHKLNCNVGKRIYNIKATQFFPSNERHANQINEANVANFKKKFVRLFRQYRHDASSPSFLANLRQFCLFIMDNFDDIEKGLRYLPNATSQMTERFIRIDNYLIENLSKKITLADVAANECLCPQYLSGEFKKKYQRTFSNILEYYRIMKAVRLLINTDMSLSNIIDRCGFVDSRRFNRSFREMLDMTPQEFKAKIALRPAVDTWYEDIDTVGFDDMIALDSPLSKLSRYFNLREHQPGVYMSEWGSGIRGTRYCLFTNFTRFHLELRAPETWFFHHGGGCTVETADRRLSFGNAPEQREIPVLVLPTGSIQIYLCSISDYAFISRLVLQ